MSAPLPRVAAVVVNYNGKEITLQAVESLRRMTYPSFDLVVLDNASTDGSPEALAAAYPDLRQVRVEVNRGSSSGYAHGFRWAFAGASLFLLLGMAGYGLMLGDMNPIPDESR